MFQSLQSLLRSSLNSPYNIFYPPNPSPQAFSPLLPNMEQRLRYDHFNKKFKLSVPDIESLPPKQQAKQTTLLKFSLLTARTSNDVISIFDLSQVCSCRPSMRQCIRNTHTHHPAPGPLRHAGPTYHLTEKEEEELQTIPPRALR